MSALARCWYCLRAYGAAEWLLRLLHRMRMLSVLHSLDFYLKEHCSEVQPDVAVRIQEVLPDQLQPFVDEACLIEAGRDSGWDTGWDYAWAQAQFASGSRLFAACLVGSPDDGRVVALNWLNTQSAELGYLNQVRVILPKDVAYSYAVWVHSAYRRRGIGSYLKKHVFDAVRRQGKQALLIAVFLDNAQARAWHLANGFRYWGRASLIGLGRYRWLWRRPALSTCLSAQPARHRLKGFLCATTR